MPSTFVAASEIRQSVFAPNELASMRSVVEAVCGELGVTHTELARRNAVAERVMAAYKSGKRLPLNMVSAGLAEHDRIIPFG